VDAPEPAALDVEQIDRVEPLEWSEEDDARLAALLEAEYGGEDLDAYIRRVSPRHIPPRHIAPIVRLWNRARYERVLACVELPPRHAKTTTGLHGLAHRINRDPACLNAFATFGDDYAASRSRICRTLARAGGAQLSKEMANLHEWRTVHGGGALFHGYQGEWTGQGINGVALVDDPFKDRRAAESGKIRENVWEWWSDVFWTRLEDNASVIVQHTRWHVDDLIGRLLDGKFSGYTFERIRLPAIADEETDPLGRAIGEALWPERFPVAELDKIERSIGPYGWASLYQQRPRPRGFQLFNDPARFLLRARDGQPGFDPTGKRVLCCADPAATEETYGDHTAAFALYAEGYGDDMKIWIVDRYYGQVTVPAGARGLRDLSHKHYRAPVAVEAAGAFKAVPQILKELEPTLRVISIKPIGDKFTRAQALAAAWNAGRVLVPLDAPWAEDTIAECVAFTGLDDPEDDQVDALAHGFNTLWASRPAKRGNKRNRNPFG
jgi:predicted phage terminase large subunit-like protein